MLVSNSSSSNRSSRYPWHTLPSFSNKSHNSALVTGSDKDGLIFNQLWLNNMNYDTHVGNDLNVNLPKTPNMILRHAHCTSSTNGSLLVF